LSYTKTPTIQQQTVDQKPNRTPSGVKQHHESTKPEVQNSQN